MIELECLEMCDVLRVVMVPFLVLNLKAVNALIQYNAYINYKDCNEHN